MVVRRRSAPTLCVSPNNTSGRSLESERADFTSARFRTAGCRPGVPTDEPTQRVEVHLLCGLDRPNETEPMSASQSAQPSSLVRCAGSMVLASLKSWLCS